MRWIGYSHICYNPIVYTYYNSTFRETLSSLFSCLNSEANEMRKKEKVSFKSQNNRLYIVKRNDKFK